MKTSRRLGAAILTAFLMFSMPAAVVGAAEDQPDSPAAVSSNSDSSDVSAEPDTSLPEEVSDGSSSSSLESSDKDLENSELDYLFSDNTEGNAELIASQEVIADDGQFQFIAVTTRSGDIFYVIIDHSKSENNVYFLNEVDTYDIQALLNKDEDGNTVVGKELSGDEETSGEDEPDSPSSSDESSTKKKSSGGFDMTTIILIGVIVLAVIVFVIFKIKKGGFGKKKNTEVEFADDLDEYDDDEEINEDEEKTK